MCGEDQARPDGDLEDQPRPKGDKFPWHVGVFDAHCHVGERRLSLAQFPAAKLRSIAVMATRQHDQDIVAAMAQDFGASSPQDLLGSSSDRKTVILGFGCHPWFSHQLYDDTTAGEPTFDPSLSEGLSEAKRKHYSSVLAPAPTDPAFIEEQPTPIPLSVFLSETRSRLASHPHAMVGEIGLDKGFRLPDAWDPVDKAKRHNPERPPGARMGRPLSQHRITMEHQRAVLAAQLKLAGEMNRAVNVHGVQAHGVLFEVLSQSWKGHERSKRALARRAKAGLHGREEAAAPLPYPPRICLHSYTAHPSSVKQYTHPAVPAEVYFSFSKTNNLRDAASREKALESIREVPDDRILVESDLHMVGERMDGEVEEMYRIVCEAKGWELEDGVRQIGDNFHRFVFGNDTHGS